MVIVDTGFWLALANAGDQYHAQAEEALRRIAQPLITTWPVMTETCHLLLRELGVPSLLAFIQSYEQDAFQVFDLKPEHKPLLHRLMKKYADLPMDLADASLIILAEHLDEGLIFSTDQRGLQTYLWKNHKPFKNLLLD